MPRTHVKARTRHEHAKKQGLALFGGYDALIARQRGCAICGKVPKPGQRRLHADHDHSTMRFRGLLCMAHNRGLKFFADNPDHLMTASFYLSYGFDAACAYRDALRTMKG